MNLLFELRRRFAGTLGNYIADSDEMLGMIRVAQDSKFGDYQANFAMPLAKRVNMPARELALEIANQVDLSGICAPPDVAGPGFINLKIDDTFLKEQLLQAFSDSHLGIAASVPTRTMVVDFSSPNVAKPMHVGHIRSTVIGDCLARVARFLGHRVITDNHLGDWGTQFGMIIYGYKHFCDAAAYQDSPVAELGRLYRFVRQLVDYHDAARNLPKLLTEHERLSQQLAEMRAATLPADKAEKKKAQQDQQRLDNKITEVQESVEAARGKIAKVDQDPELKATAENHPQIGVLVQEETARLHAGDAENLALWHAFLPYCRQDIERIYSRLEITFDHALGESFYQDQLQAVVEDFQSRQLAELSEGAICVFLEGFDSPMLIQKRDGAFLYATTDLATIKYRLEHWQPDVILYVVDHRQHEHFEKLFAAAKKWGIDSVELRHVSFGTVLGDDGKPFKTRAGDTVGLEGLLDEAERRALAVLDGLRREDDAGLTPEEQQEVARVIGIGALKFADLSQHRASDYKFSYEKMLELKGFTATYLQYLYARVQGIYRNSGLEIASLMAQPVPFEFTEEIERQLALSLLRFSETLEDVLVDYRPNLLAQYLFELTQTFFKFYDHCSVLKAETESLKRSRLQLCELTARTIRQGLGLMGIGVVEKM